MDAVIGLGKAGTEIVKQLLASGRSVRGIDFQDPATRLEEFGHVPNGVELQLLQGDATNAQSMAKCLEGIGGVVLAFQGKSYFSAGRVDEGGIKVVATAAKAAGTMRIVLLSSLLVTDSHRRHPLRIMLNNIRRGMMDRKRDGEEHLRRCGVPYCIVRPGRFVDKPAGAAAKLKTGQGDTLSGSISPVDVATICIGALRDPDADGVTFEVIDEWAKAPDEQTTDETLAAADSSSTGPKQSVQQQVQEMFRELKADAPPVTILSAHGL